MSHSSHESHALHSVDNPLCLQRKVTFPRDQNGPFMSIPVSQSATQRQGNWILGSLDFHTSSEFLLELAPIHHRLHHRPARIQR